jgi:hypothetical protein
MALTTGTPSIERRSRNRSARVPLRRRHGQLVHTRIERRNYDHKGFDIAAALELQLGPLPFARSDDCVAGVLAVCGRGNRRRVLGGRVPCARCHQAFGQCRDGYRCVAASPALTMDITEAQLTWLFGCCLILAMLVGYPALTTANRIESGEAANNAPPVPEPAPLNDGASTTVRDCTQTLAGETWPLPFPTASAQ